ncbi:ABC transporter permease [Microvirga makkahensis]|uniref:ABC transporter permease n=1 Tax=Microvirga makkahensis TaxID=1128670 RepID=A0A7X3SRZ7_9HYPH|nr:ABC transporter permease [Microvirga makkahensis]MXQ14614.1 ABC transporter permease [Microvirga makkahensis]
MNSRNRITIFILQAAPYLLFLAILLVFGSLSDRFLSVTNFTNIVIQAAPVAILAVGMTFVLLTAEIDLSVGAIMYLTGCLLGLYLGGAPWPLALVVVLVASALLGAINGVLVAYLGITSFIATLGTLFIGRGIAMSASNTASVYFPDAITALNRATVFGIPSAIVAVAVVFAVAWILLRQTPFGRQVYAVGQDRDAAAKAGLPAKRIVFLCFVISGALAGIAGFVSVTQIGAITASYGLQAEFSAIAAAVLGGTSLFGGRGGVKGALFGALLIQTAANGLVIINANPYIYPLVTAGIIFIAVAVDGLRSRMLERLERRFIRPWEIA